MPMIRECVVTTVSADGRPHIAPLGLIADDAVPNGEGWIVAPFRPSTTLDNLRAQPVAVANLTDDARIFAGCLTGRRDWPLVPVPGSPVPRLEAALAHMVLDVTEVLEDDIRPRFRTRIREIVGHHPFPGLNRATAAVVELAILTSRLGMIPRDKVEREIDYLRIAIDKTAGPAEAEAWGWLMERVATFYSTR